MHLTLAGINPHPQGLLLRVIHRSQRTGWVQFATVLVPFDDLDEYLRGYILRRLETLLAVEEPDEPLF